jgi:hypothetical protein
MAIFRFFYRFFAALLPNAWKILKAFREKGGKLRFWIAVMDFLFVMRGMAMFLFLNLLGFVFFVSLTQGTDLLTSIMEDSKESYFGTITWVVLGVFFWSVVAEFGARYSMNVTDNSGKTLTDERVEWRKLLQTFFARFFLFLPPLTMIIGFTKAAIANYNFRISGFFQPWKDVGLTIFIFICLFILIYHLYVETKWIDSVGRLFRFLRLSKSGEEDDEKKWQKKLYGIYKDYIFMFPEAALPKNMPQAKQVMRATDEMSEEEKAVLYFPQSEKVPYRNRVPAKFTIIRFERPGPDDMWCRWVYRVPFSFFPRLHRQVAVISLTAIALILTVSVLPIGMYKDIGSPGLVTFAFAAWLGVYIGLLFLDHSRPFTFNPPWRVLLFVWLIICSVINNDHPVRKKSDDINAADSRPALNAHFNQWAAKHPNDSIIVFVCAEGGALRTGAFSSLVLSKIQDMDSSFKDKIFAFSSVSGGSLGIGYFNALAYFNTHEQLIRDAGYYSNKTKDFFSRDHLAPLMGKMFYGDVINLFSPRMISAFDRAGALERSWENGYEYNAAYNDNPNIFASDYYTVYNPHDSVFYPAWFINTEEVETGLQGWVTNVDARNLPFGRSRDVLKKVEGSIRYSTAINFSTRFPLFSPAGALDYQLNRYHYVDGGYVENYGAQTMVEVLRELAKNETFRKYRPYVMMIQFGNDMYTRPGKVKFANELTEVVTGIYGTRAGRGKYAKRDLVSFVDSLRGRFVDVPLDINTAKVPMNWVLSDTSLNRLDDYCNRIVRSNAGILDILKAIKYTRVIPSDSSSIIK